MPDLDNMKSKKCLLPDKSDAHHFNNSARTSSKSVNGMK